MKPIIIEGTPKTPTIRFDVSEGIFEIKGRSIPENSVEFYKPLIDWLENYKETPLDKTVAIFALSILIQALQNAYLMFSRNWKPFIRPKMML